MTPPRAVITVGPPACGKSTYARGLAGYVECNLDRCRQQLHGDEADQSDTTRVVALRDRFLRRLIGARCDIVVSDTNAVPVYRAALIDRLRRAGYAVEVVIFETPLDVCLDRNRNRPRSVPEDVLARLHGEIALEFRV